MRSLTRDFALPTQTDLPRRESDRSPAGDLNLGPWSLRAETTTRARLRSLGSGTRALGPGRRSSISISWQSRLLDAPGEQVQVPKAHVGVCDGRVQFRAA